MRQVLVRLEAAIKALKPTSGPKQKEGVAEALRIVDSIAPRYPHYIPIAVACGKAQPPIACRWLLQPVNGRHGLLVPANLIYCFIFWIVLLSFICLLALIACRACHLYLLAHKVSLVKWLAGSTRHVRVMLGQVGALQLLRPAQADPQAHPHLGRLCVRLLCCPAAHQNLRESR